MEEINFLTRIIMWSSQIAAFVAAILFWKKYNKSSQRYFIYFLAFVILIEFSGYSILKIFHFKNYFIYNIFTIVSGLFYLFWFRSILAKKELLAFFISVFLITLGYSILFEDFFKLWKVPLLIFAFLILICSTLFYSELLKKEDVVNFKTNQKFWIVTGVLIFYIGYLPLFLFQKYLDVSGIFFRITITILNIIMYGCYTISFICLNKK